MGQNYELKIISVSEIHWKRNLIRLPGHDTPKLYVAIDIDGKRVHRTNPSRKQVAMQNQICSLLVDGPSSVIALQIFHKSTFPFPRGAERRANASIRFICTMSDADFVDFPVVLNFVEEKNATDTPGPTLVVRMTSIGHVQAGTVALANVTQDIGIPKSASTSPTIVGVDNGDLLSGLKTVLSRLKIVHPYSNVAWMVLVSVYEAVKKQKETDENVARLVQTMADVYTFAEDIESAVTEKIKRFEKTIYALVKQTEECSLFIREYTGHEFSGRLINSVLSEDSDKIGQFITAFEKLRDSLDRGTAVEILFVSTKALAMVEETAQIQRLNSLKMVDMNASLRPECLPGTRQEIRALIMNWLTTPPDGNNPGNILWLSGVAGAGKSTIATSVSQYFRELGRLGAFLFFNKADKSRSDPANVIRTIAFYLARSNVHIASAIYDAIRNDPASIDSPIQTQFQKLLLDPLTASQSHIHGPIIIVLDALDECGNAESRWSLVSLISDDFPKLPPAVRFFITSRPDSDIASKFEIQPKIVKFLLDVTMESSFTDIRIYLDNQMAEIRKRHNYRNLSPTWPEESYMKALTERSSGLFIWASTATKYLLQSYKPNDALKSILDKGLTTLDDLYAEALEVAGPWNDPAFIREAQAALSTVVLGKVPMSDTTIDAILGLDPESSSSQIFSELGCVLQWAPGQHVKILHASFSDYLTDHGRSGGKPWFIDPSILEPHIARGCLQVLKKGLQFNICGFKDSHIYTTQVPDLSNRIADCISPHLLYASLFWANHLVGTGSDTPYLPDGLLTDLQDLMDNKFLFWLEILCIKQKTGIAKDALEAVAKLAKNCHKEKLVDFATDAVKFVIAFAPVISHSVPHIYISALPFAPSESKWRVNGQDCKTIEGHTDAVYSVVFSPDGNCIASGSADKTLRVWDARTGDLIVGPFNGHNDEVNCVAFSRDGENIVSGSYDQTVRVWDARTGKTIGVPLIGHTGRVYSVCFSPKGKQIASASQDQTVCIWDWDEHSEGNMVALVIKHAASVRTIAFLPHGDQVVSGSKDGLVRVWNTQTGKLVAGSLKGPDINGIWSVAVSPDGKYIASVSDKAARIWDSACMGVEIIAVTTPMGSRCFSVAFTPNGKQIVVGYADRMLRIWDVQTGVLVSAPIDGHNKSVVSISVSPDGMRIASSSNDMNICVWDAQELSATLKLDSQYTGANNQEILQMLHPGCTGHTDIVWSIAFSPKGDHIASGSWDSTVCVWDACTGTIVTGPLHGHKNRVICIAFSSNGEQIVSGSKDTTIRVWNAQNGTMVAGPFEGHSDKVRCVAFSQQGDRIVSGSDDSMVCVWDVAMNSLVIKLPNIHTRPVQSVAFSLDGGQIRSVSVSDIARVSDAQTGALVEGPFKALVDNRPYTFSPDSQLVGVSGKDGVVRVFDLRSQNFTRLPVEGQTATKVYVTAFSRDGKWIVSGSKDTIVRVWDLETRVLIADPFEGHRGAVASVDFSPDRRRVVSGSYDTSIRVFEITPDHTLKEALGGGSLGRDGWLLNSMSQPILWVPPWLHRGLYFPRNSLVIHKDGTTKLNFTRFVDGTAWEECMDPQVRLS
ncbi:WD40-repeat-containing domain protein [Rhodocollybia butyracea]|uniref:WD40-repeat-containing domain protein n=1 Tax=Rhodocollybia butyracea TaxID=206335 RepID=A0A9P5UBZ9_9AGAR|nr:WD40-repeat-containing domain protein [Rhodocollybia butyracea]